MSDLNILQSVTKDLEEQMQPCGDSAVSAQQIQTQQSKCLSCVLRQRQ